MMLSGVGESVTQAAVFVALHGSVTPSALATRTVRVRATVEPTCAESRKLSGFTVSRSAVAGLMSLSRRHVVTDTASAKTKATGVAGAARMTPKSRLIGDLGYNVNGFWGRAPAHAVAVALQAVCLSSVAPITFAGQQRQVRGELRPIAATLNKSLKSRGPGVRIGDGDFFSR